MEASGVSQAFEAAMRAAEKRANELGNEFGAWPRAPCSRRRGKPWTFFMAF